MSRRSLATIRSSWFKVPSKMSDAASFTHGIELFEASELSAEVAGLSAEVVGGSRVVFK